MARNALRVEECCAWCRQPVQKCTESSCDDTRTYTGTLVSGEWRIVDEARQQPAESQPR